MPIYEYSCQQCGHQTEKFESLSASPATQCDACGKDTLKRLVSAPNFQLKGTGWYVTDFKDKQKKAPTSTSAGSADSASGKASDTKTTDNASTADS